MSPSIEAAGRTSKECFMSVRIVKGTSALACKDFPVLYFKVRLSSKNALSSSHVPSLVLEKRDKCHPTDCE